MTRYECRSNFVRIYHFINLGKFSTSKMEVFLNTTLGRTISIVTTTYHGVFDLLIHFTVIETVFNHILTILMVTLKLTTRSYDNNMAHDVVKICYRCEVQLLSLGKCNQHISGSTRL